MLVIGLASIGWRSEHAPTGHDELMAALPITHDSSELFGIDRRQRRRGERGRGLRPDSASRNRLHIDANFSRFACQSSSFEKPREDDDAGYSY
jgi:hypothetical protein